jgi:hypothetical protein
MKALSLIQPWASAIILGKKRIETRKWKTGYRGMVAIHASKRMSKEDREFMRSLGIFPPEWKPPMGAILGTVTLADVKRVEEVRGNLSDLERSLGNYSDGRWAWVLTDIMAFDQSISCGGALRLWEVPEVIVGAVIERWIYGGGADDWLKQTNGQKKRG